MDNVFISYSSKDLQQATHICHLLERNNVNCWIAPGSIPVGSNYTKAIPTAISSCPVFIVLVTQNAQHSRFVIKELEFAVSSGKLILPVFLENCPLTEEFRFLIGVEHHLLAYAMPEHIVEKILVQRILNPSVTAPEVEFSSSFTPTGTVDLTIVRKRQFSGCAVAINVSVDDGMPYQIRSGNTITIPLPIGEHLIYTSFAKRKTVVKINLVKDSQVSLGFDPLWGRLEIKPVSQIAMSIIESR